MPTLRHVLIAADQLANTMVGGYPDETLSARAWRRQFDSLGWSILREALDMLFFWDADHCLESYNNERLRRQLPAEYRET